MKKKISEPKILYVIALDDSKAFLDSLRSLLSGNLQSKENKFTVKLEYLTDIKGFFQLVEDYRKEEKFLALVISDLVMPDMNGLDVLKKLKKTNPDSMRIVLTGKADLSSAVQAINNNLVDQYINKPIKDPEQFIATINMFLENFYLRKEQKKKEIKEKIHLERLSLLNRKISAMQGISEQIAYFSQEIKRLDLDEILNIIVKRIPPLFNAKAVSVFLFDRETNLYHLVRDNHIGENATFTYDPSQKTPMQRVIEKNEILIIDDVSQSSLQFSGKQELGNSCVVIPFRAIQNKSKLAGVSREDVNVSNICGMLNLSKIETKEDRIFTSYKASLIQDILGANISNAQLYQVFQETHKLAVTDGLTGLYNNRVFREFLQVEFEQARRYKQDFSVVMADIDFFKSVNDKHGHLVGDQLLRSLAKTMRKSLRRSDIVARYGGEEFAFILPQTTMKKTFRLMEKVRKIIEQTSFTKHRIRVTVSFGIAETCFPMGDSELKLLDKADKALYRAKEKGRNRVELAPEIKRKKESEARKKKKKRA